MKRSTSQSPFVQVVTAVALAAAMSLLPACGGGGSHGVGGGSTGLSTGSFTKQFSGTDDGGNAFPFGSNSLDSKTQHLYYASEINGSGKITTLRLNRNVANAAAISCPNVSVKMGHTNLTVLSTTFANNINTNQGSLMTVLNDATVSIPAGAVDTWFDVALATPFEYNGVDNLVVEFSRNTKCSQSMSTNVTAAAGARRAYSSATDATTGVGDYDAVTATGTDSTENWMQFVFAGGDNRAFPADSTSNGGVSGGAPGATGRVQMLIRAQDINGSGPITGIKFRADTLTAAATGTYSVTLSHVSAGTTDLTTTFANNIGSGATLVAQNVAVSIPAGAPDFWIPLTGTFSYDGTSNLLVDITANLSAGFTLDYEVIPNNRVVFGGVSATTGSLFARSFGPTFRFHGGPIHFITAENGQSYFLGVTGTPISQQVLYNATELGTGGAITRIACRAYANYPARSYANTQVVMVNTSITTLSATYANNIVGGSTVFSGTLNVPAVQKGDWIEIPLASAFSYSSSGNLVIQLSSDGGPAADWCVMGADATRWPGRTFQNGVSPVNVIYDMKFWISK